MASPRVDSSIFAFSAAQSTSANRRRYSGCVAASAGSENVFSSHGRTTFWLISRSQSRPPHISMPPCACRLTRPSMPSAIATSSVPPPRS